MIRLTRSTLALVLCASGLLLHTLPAVADGIGSGQIRPVAGKTMVYETFIDTSDCKPQEGAQSHIYASPLGVATAYYDNTQLTCPTGYTMVDWNNFTVGGTNNILGGYVYGKSNANCCAVKQRWAAPKAVA